MTTTTEATAAEGEAIAADAPTGPAIGRHWPDVLPPRYGTPESIGPVLDALAWGPLPVAEVPGPVFQYGMTRMRWVTRCAVGALPLANGAEAAELFGVEGETANGPRRAYLVRGGWSSSGELLAFDVLPAGALDVAELEAPAVFELAEHPAELEPIGSATYNVTDDKIRLSFDRRLTAEEYEQAKRAGFAFWHGSKLFVSKWSTHAEDFARRTCGELEEDDTPDDVESRVARFAGYKGSAERSAASAQSYVARIADGIPMGQPILVGHHSERHARADQKRMESGMRRAIAESERAAYWRGRIAGAISRAAYREKPGVIARRIKGLETDERRAVKSMSPPELFGGVLHHAGTYRDGATTYDVVQALRVWAGAFEFNRRVRDHVRMRLEYERAMLEAVGGLPTEGDGKRWEVGGAVRMRGGWAELTKVNKVTFQAKVRFGEHIKWSKTEAAGLMTRAEFEAYKRGEFDPDAAELEACNADAAPADSAVTS